MPTLLVAVFFVAATMALARAIVRTGDWDAYVRWDDQGARWTKDFVPVPIRWLLGTAKALAVCVTTLAIILSFQRLRRWRRS